MPRDSLFNRGNILRAITLLAFVTPLILLYVFVHRYLPKPPAPPAIAQTEEQLEARRTDPAFIEQGRKFYVRVCSRCHGQQAEGGVGPNLTDDYWIRGDGHIINLVKNIQEGAPEKGMPAWEAMSDQIDIEAVAVYVSTLAGSNPARAKAPQGDKK